MILSYCENIFFTGQVTVLTSGKSEINQPKSFTPQGFVTAECFARSLLA